MGNVTIYDNTFITGTLKNQYNNIIPNQSIIINIGISYTITKDNNGKYTYNYKTNILGKNNVTITYNGNSKYNPNIVISNFNVIKVNPNIHVNVTNNTVCNVTTG